MSFWEELSECSQPWCKRLFYALLVLLVIFVILSIALLGFSPYVMLRETLRNAEHCNCTTESV